MLNDQPIMSREDLHKAVADAMRRDAIAEMGYMSYLLLNGIYRPAQDYRLETLLEKYPVPSLEYKPQEPPVLTHFLESKRTWCHLYGFRQHYTGDFLSAHNFDAIVVDKPYYYKPSILGMFSVGP